MIARSGFAAFRYREYQLFWLAAAFSNVGMWSLIYATLWLMHDLTDSPLMVGLVSTASMAPVLLFSMWGGVVADQVNRLKLLRATRAMFSALTLLTGFLIAAEVIQPWHILAISVVQGILLSFDGPSRSAMVPALVPKDHLASAIALYSLVFGAASILGPAILAPLVNLWGLEGVFFLIGAAYTFTVVTLAFMNPAGHQAEKRPTNVIRGVIDGLGHIRLQPVIAGVLILGSIAATFGHSYQALLPVFSDKILAGGIDVYSRLLLYSGIGGVAATLTLVVLGTRVHPARFFAVAGICYGLGILALSRLTWFPGAALNIGLISACAVVFQITSTTLMLSLVADEFRGRVMSIHQLSWGAAAFGGLLMGGLAESVGVSAAMSLGGLVVVLASVMVAVATLRQVLTGASETPSKPISPGRRMPTGGDGPGG